MGKLELDPVVSQTDSLALKRLILNRLVRNRRLKLTARATGWLK